MSDLPETVRLCQQLFGNKFLGNQIMIVCLQTAEKDEYNLQKKERGKKDVKTKAGIWLPCSCRAIATLPRIQRLMKGKVGLEGS